MGPHARLSKVCDTNRACKKLGLKLNGSLVLLAKPHWSVNKRRITYPRYIPCVSCWVAHYARACISSSGTYLRASLQRASSVDLRPIARFAIDVSSSSDLRPGLLCALVLLRLAPPRQTSATCHASSAFPIQVLAGACLLLFSACCCSLLAGTLAASARRHAIMAYD